MWLAKKFPLSMLLGLLGLSTKHSAGHKAAVFFCCFNSEHWSQRTKARGKLSSRIMLKLASGHLVQLRQKCQVFSSRARRYSIEPIYIRPAESCSALVRHLIRDAWFFYPLGKPLALPFAKIELRHDRSLPQAQRGLPLALPNSMFRIGRKLITFKLCSCLKPHGFVTNALSSNLKCSQRKIKHVRPRSI